MRFLILSVAVFGVASYLAVSSTHASEPAHEHGVGVLNLAVEGKDVEIELTVPGADAVGFEHTPSSDEDRQAVEKAIGKFKAADQLFRFPPAAQCKIEDSEVHAAQLDGEHKDDDHGHKKSMTTAMTMQRRTRIVRLTPSSARIITFTAKIPPS